MHFVQKMFVKIFFYCNLLLQNSSKWQLSLTNTSSTCKVNHCIALIDISVQIPRPPSSQQAGSPSPSECNSMGALDLTPKPNQNALSPGPSPGPPSLFSAFGLLPQVSQTSTPLMTSALSSLTSSVLTSTSFSPLRLAVGPGASLG